MTATATAPTTSGTAPGRPSTTRVTVLTGRRMTDLVLPSAAPIESYVDETVAVLGEILTDTPADVLGGFDFRAQGVWSFARPGAPPIKLTDSLDDAGVVDGSREREQAHGKDGYREEREHAHVCPHRLQRHPLEQRPADRA